MIAPILYSTAWRVKAQGFFEVTLNANRIRPTAIRYSVMGFHGPGDSSAARSSECACGDIRVR
jgi:hypothetical protein